MPASFYILAVFTIISATAAMSLRSMIHCALCLALTFLGVAGLFLQLNAGFLAFAQILVYVGAVAILIVFAILLTRGAQDQEPRRSSGLLLSIPLAVIVAVPAAYAFSRFRFPGRRFLFFSVLLRNIFPAVIFLVPLFILMRAACSSCTGMLS